MLFLTLLTLFFGTCQILPNSDVILTKILFPHITDYLLFSPSSCLSVQCLSLYPLQCKDLCHFLLSNILFFSLHISLNLFQNFTLADLLILKLLETKTTHFRHRVTGFDVFLCGFSLFPHPSIL